MVSLVEIGPASGFGEDFFFERCLSFYKLVSSLVEIGPVVLEKKKKM